MYFLNILTLIKIKQVDGNSMSKESIENVYRGDTQTTYTELISEPTSYI